MSGFPVTWKVRESETLRKLGNFTCLNGHAPLYLSDCCVAVAGTDTQWHLNSANHQLLAVPHLWLNTYGRGAFSCNL